MGNLVSSEAVYNKQDTETLFTKKSDIYTKKESDTRFQPKGEYQPKGDYAVVEGVYVKADVYNKTESDTRFQPKGEYALTTALAGYQPKGDYAVVGGVYAKADVYNKTESDTRFQPKGDYALTSTLASYAKNTDITNTLTSYAKKTDILKGDKGDKGDKGGVQIDDTRSANSPPSFYRAKGVNKYFELKTKTVIGTPSKQEYNYLETIVSWKDASGGPVVQIAYGENAYYRQSIDENTWSPWRIIAQTDANGTLIATKPDNWNSAVQIGSTNDPKDSNIYSLSFGKGDSGTWTGMGLVPNDKKAFGNSTGPVLGTHIQEMGEWGIMSSGWNKLFAVQGKTGNVKVKGNLEATDITATGNTQIANAFVSNDLWFNGPTNKWIFHTPDDGRTEMYIAPSTDAKNDWNWPNATIFYKDGSITTKKLTATDLNATNVNATNICNRDNKDCINFNDIRNVITQNNALRAEVNSLKAGNIPSQTITLGDGDNRWQIQGDWWEGDRNNKALIFRKIFNDGNGDADSMILTSGGIVKAKDNVYSEKWKKCL